MYAYQIIGGAGGGWALAVDKNNAKAGAHAGAVPVNHQDPDQQWLFALEPQSGQLMIYNPHRDLAAAASPGIAQVTVAAPNPQNASNLWTMVGNGPSHVIRCGQSDDWNLTQSGPWVSVASWERGAPQQLWNLMLVQATTAAAH